MIVPHTRRRILFLRLTSRARHAKHICPATPVLTSERSWFSSEPDLRSRQRQGVREDFANKNDARAGWFGTGHLGGEIFDRPQNMAFVGPSRPLYQESRRRWVHAIGKQAPGQELERFH